MSTQQLIDKTKQIFASSFGYQPTDFIQAPARVNLIGEHTDYNDGFVLPCAINYQTVISASKREDATIRVISADYDNQQDEFLPSADLTPHPEYLWANYVRGVVKYLCQRGYSLGGADLVISGNVPQGAGLSSSASLEVAVGQTMNHLNQLDIDLKIIALNGQQAENQFVGCNCGIMDQFISALGQKGNALLIDCRDLSTQAVAMPVGVDVVIINSNVKRGLVGSEYNLRREQCEAAAQHFGVKALRDLTIDQLNERIDELDPAVAKRARHVVTENARTLEACQALQEGDLPRLAMLMGASHRSMRDDFEITVPAIDELVSIVGDVVGSRGGVRMTGGGFGGCVVALVPQELTQEVCKQVRNEYPKRTALEPTIYICQPSAGAGVIKPE
ncbi:galactokinase [Celerinatantimonas sp. YJH-8]|uniref:galactokinase n=1 Tax=Celerinatantimonas sp. YJH-8 TaxID=3228714 RepID=UPI0038C2AF94